MRLPKLQVPVLRMGKASRGPGQVSWATRRLEDVEIRFVRVPRAFESVDPSALAQPWPFPHQQLLSVTGHKGDTLAFPDMMHQRISW
jgi:hypothetical protein